jgi:hypothetical protein
LKNKKDLIKRQAVSLPFLFQNQKKLKKRHFGWIFAKEVKAAEEMRVFWLVLPASKSKDREKQDTFGWQCLPQNQKT